MILRYVLISWSRKDGTSWYAIIARITTSALTSNGAVLLRYMYNLSAPTVYVDISSVRVCVCVLQGAVNSVMPQDFSSVDASASSRYVSRMHNL